MDLLRYLQDTMQALLEDRGQGGILLGLSGGADSVALFHLLRLYCPKQGLAFSVAHVDHGLRPSAAAEAAFVRDLCDHYQLPFFLKKVDLRALAQKNKRGLEEEGRLVRRAFFEKICRAEGLDYIALAHHADDQAETLLLNLLRGSALRGLGGMRSVSGPYIRPFLGVSKKELLAYLDEAGYDYVEDESNLDPSYRRNRIRREVLPLLEEINPKLRKNLLDLSRVLQADSRALEAYYEDFFKAKVRRLGRLALAVDAALFFRAPQALRLRFYQEAYRTLTTRPLEKKYLWPLDQALLGGGSKDLPGGVFFTLKGGEVRAGSKRIDRAAYQISLADLLARLGPRSSGQLEADLGGKLGLKVKVSLVLRKDFARLSPAERGGENFCYVDGRAFDGEVFVCSPARGMVYQPYASPYRISLAKHFSSLAYGPLANQRLPVLVQKKYEPEDRSEVSQPSRDDRAGEDIIWPYGGRVNKDYAVTDKTQSIYLICILNNIERENTMC